MTIDYRKWNIYHLKNYKLINYTSEIIAQISLVLEISMSAQWKFPF